MKFCFILLFLSSFNFIQAQNLVEKHEITDLSETPIYEKLTQTVDEKLVWKDEYKYLDDIEMYWITYMSDGLKVKGLLVKPKKEGKYPCIIYNRGGNREFGSLKVYHAALRLGKLAKEGYIVIASNYRGNDGGEGQEEFGGKDVNDVVNLIDVLLEIDGADTSKIGMFGWSRGGMMTYIALTKTNKIKAAIVGGGLSDCNKMIDDRPEMESVFEELVPNYKANKEVELNKRSAVNWADKFSKNVPILLLHGNADWRVKVAQSYELAMKLDQERVPYRLIVFEGGDHSLQEHKKEVGDQILNWFDRFLKNDEKLPVMKYHGG